MFGFIIALIAGFVTPGLDGPVARPLARALAPVLRIEEGEIRLLSFLVAMLVAGVFCAIFDSGSVLGAMIGAGLGYFLLRLSGALRALLDKR